MDKIGLILMTIKQVNPAIILTFSPVAIVINITLEVIIVYANRPHNKA